MKTKAKKILIVDDDPQFILLAQSRLEANDYEIQTAVNGVEAIKLAHDWQPDLVLLDMILPAMEGYDICKILKSSEETKKIPIIILTASTKKESHAKCLSAGALVVVLKPFHPLELLALIKKAFDPNSKWRKIESAFN